VGTAPTSVATGDFNGDSIIDLAVADFGENQDVSVLIGMGDGTFMTEQRFTAGGRPISITTGDFDNDGNMDLATANWGSNDVSVLIGMGDGTFQAQQPSLDLGGSGRPFLMRPPT
jgi:hypothetical protein